MGGMRVIVLFGFVAAICANEIPASLGEEFCKEYPHLHLCRLQSILEGALNEIQYLVNGDTVTPTSSTVSKRKSAFVRFGKRVDDEEDNEKEIEKRKSAFVRFGRSDNDKRKSSYIRFG